MNHTKQCCDPVYSSLFSPSLPASTHPPRPPRQDIINFFQGFDLAEGNIHLVTSLEGRNTGEAFAEFSSSDDSRAAMQGDKGKMGNRYVELFPSSREEATHKAAQSRGMSI